MKDFDFGYFGTGDEGYAQYMTAFERNSAPTALRPMTQTAMQTAATAAKRISKEVKP